MGIAEDIVAKLFISRHDDHDDDDDSESPVVAKVVAMCVLFLASMLLGCLPLQLSKYLKLEKTAKNGWLVNVLLCIGGGVLLCTTFLHLFPEVSEKLEELQEEGVLPEFQFHMAELLMCIGFFTMYFIEECVHAYLAKRERNGLSALRRSLSIRRGEPLTLNSKEDQPKTANDNNIKPHHHHTLPQHHDHHQDHSHAGHSHVIFEDTVVKSIRGLLIVLALSVHELFEGLAIGLESSSSSVWLMFGAVSAHKLVIAFCIGVELVSGGVRKLLAVIYVFTFAVVSPMGIGIGIAVTGDATSETDKVSVILQGLASGTLLYVVFFEILQSERKSGLRQWLSVLAGFAVMFVITMFSGHTHSHSHGDDDTTAETTTAHYH